MNTLQHPDSHQCKDIQLHTDQTTYSEYFFAKNFQRERSELQLVGGGVEHCKPNYSIHREHFMYYAIEYIASGNCRLKINGEEYELGPGSVFSYGPHLEYEIETIGNDPVIKYFVNFTGEAILDEFNKSFILEGIPMTLPHIKWIREIFLQIQDCGSSQNPKSQDLSVYLIKYLISRLECSEIKKNEPVSPSYVTYQSCRSYIESRYLDIRSISEVADACNVSICHVSRLFKRYTDTSPCSLLTSLKLNRSRELLKDSNLLIKQIAELVGIDDQYYFSNRFKQHFGISPMNYKRNLAENNSSAA